MRYTDESFKSYLTAWVSKFKAFKELFKNDESKLRAEIVIALYEELHTQVVCYLEDSLLEKKL